MPPKKSPKKPTKDPQDILESAGESTIEDIVEKSVRTSLDTIVVSFRKEMEDIQRQSLESVTAALEKSMNRMVEDIKKSLEAKICALENHLTAVEDKMSNLEMSVQLKIDELATKSTNLECKLTDISDDVLVLHKQARQSLIISNETEQYSRRNNLRIRGLPLDGRDCTEVVREFLHNKLNIDLETSDIAAAHIFPIKKRSNDSSNTTSDSSVKPQHGFELHTLYHCEVPRKISSEQRY